MLNRGRFDDVGRRTGETAKVPGSILIHMVVLQSTLTLSGVKLGKIRIYSGCARKTLLLNQVPRLKT